MLYLLAYFQLEYHCAYCDPCPLSVVLLHRMDALAPDIINVESDDDGHTRAIGRSCRLRGGCPRGERPPYMWLLFMHAAFAAELLRTDARMAGVHICEEQFTRVDRTESLRYVESIVNTVYDNETAILGD